MKTEGKRDNENLRRNLSQYVKVRLGQTVPVLEHKNCVGDYGRVTDIDDDKVVSVKCASCGNNNVILDGKVLSNSDYE